MYTYEKMLYSSCLNRNMSIRVYGHGGWPVLVFPTQDSMSDNYENFGMIGTLSGFLNDGIIQLFCVDTVDRDSWSAKEGDPEYRAWLQEQYFYHIIDEVVPVIHAVNQSDLRPLATGCSMGATHAAIVFLRRPDLFEGTLSLSGVYDAAYFFGDWMNSTLYANSPATFMPNLPADHPYIPIYNHRSIIFCVGQGAWEDEGIRSQKVLEKAFHDKNIRGWFDYWGHDVNHDWDWWQKQYLYFIPLILEDCYKRSREA